MIENFCTVLENGLKSGSTLKITLDPAEARAILEALRRDQLAGAKGK